MPTYSIPYISTASTCIRVEADNPEAAKEVAEEQFDPPTICAHCAGMFSTRPGIDMNDEWQQVNEVIEVTP